MFIRLLTQIPQLQVIITPPRKFYRELSLFHMSVVSISSANSVTHPPSTQSAQANRRKHINLNQNTRHPSD
jgi:hypothetical protein